MPAETASLYLSAAEAAAFLGVSRSTLYVYVSRKLIRSEAMPGDRSHRYWRADVERIKRGPKSTVVASLEDRLASESRLTLLTRGGQFYRGFDAIELSRHASFEEVVLLLWEGEPGLFDEAFVADPVSARFLKQMTGWSAVDQALSLFPIIERADPRSYDLSPAGTMRTGARVLRWFARLVGGNHHNPHLPLHEYLAKERHAPTGFEQVIRALLVLNADHELDSSTYAVRAVANSGVPPYKAVMAGLISSEGQRFMRERIGPVRRLLHEILKAREPEKIIHNRLRAGEYLPGFSASGHYHADPRAFEIMDALERWNGSDRELLRLKRAALVATDSAQLTMDFVVAASFIGYKLGMHGEELNLIRLSKMAGWIAHAMEQYRSGSPVHGRARYVGRLPG